MKVKYNLNGKEGDIEINIDNHKPISSFEVPIIEGFLKGDAIGVPFTELIEERQNDYIKECYELIDSEFKKALIERAEPPILEATVENLKDAGIVKCIHKNKVWLEQRGKIISSVIEFSDIFMEYLK